MMRAAVLTEAGATPEIDDFREPSGDDEGTIIDVTLAGLNPVDLAIGRGVMPARLPELPAVVGLEGIGRGADGKRVYFDSPVAPFGSMAERVLVDASRTYPVPDGVDDGLAVAFGIAGLAAWLSLEWRARLETGETVLVLGSSGVVGQIAIQGAKLLGAAKVIAASRRDEDLERAAGLGADETVRIDEEGDLAERFREAGGEEGIDVIIDPLWGEPAAAALEAIAMHGRLVQIGNSAGQTAELPARGMRNQLASIIGHTNFNAPLETKAGAYEAMCRHAVAGELSVDVEIVGLDDVAAAWERQAQSPRHKIAIAPG